MGRTSRKCHPVDALQPSEASVTFSSNRPDSDGSERQLPRTFVTELSQFGHVTVTCAYECHINSSVTESSEGGER